MNGRQDSTSGTGRGDHATLELSERRPARKKADLGGVVNLT